MMLDLKPISKNSLNPNFLNPSLSRSFLDNQSINCTSIHEKSEIYTSRTPFTDDIFDNLSDFNNCSFDVEEDFESKQIDEYIQIIIYNFAPPRFIRKNLIYEEQGLSTRLNSVSHRSNNNKQNDTFNLLVIDQDWFFLQTLKLYMIGKKVKIETASSEEEAIKIIDEKDNMNNQLFHMILIECKGPTTKVPINITIIKDKIKKSNKVPILITGYTVNNDEVYHKQLKKAGIDDIMMKPIKISKLKEYIDSHRKICC